MCHLRESGANNDLNDLYESTFYTAWEIVQLLHTKFPSQVISHFGVQQHWIDFTPLDYPLELFEAEGVRKQAQLDFWAEGWYSQSYPSNSTTIDYKVMENF